MISCRYTTRHQTNRNHFVELPPGRDKHLFVLVNTLAKHVILSLRAIADLHHTPFGLVR